MIITSAFRIDEGLPCLPSHAGVTSLPCVVYIMRMYTSGGGSIGRVVMLPLSIHGRESGICRRGDNAPIDLPMQMVYPPPQRGGFNIAAGADHEGAATHLREISDYLTGEFHLQLTV